ncbi:LCC4 [Anthophora quadrimaculata]
MNIIQNTFLLTALIFTVAGQDVDTESVTAGYVPGVSGMVPIDWKNCLNDELRTKPFLSTSLECARTCRIGESKTCYYKFVVERYPINGQACNLCMPNITNTVCPNCQCVPGDGTQRMALTVNRMIPGPTIQVCKGDRVIVDVVNMLKSDSVTIHWHGLFQRGSPHYDGVPHLTQCPIMIQDTFRYQFDADNGGTHLWHAHTGTQKLDGLFGSFIVREPEQEEPYSRLYNFDLANHVIIISDWFKEESTSRIPGRRAGETRHSAEAVLINGKGRYVDPSGATTNIPLEVITVSANQGYRFRLINSFCTVCPGELIIEGHSLTVIASDGQHIKPVWADSIISLAGERYDFVLNTNQKPGAYWIQLRGLDSCSSDRIQQLAILQYEGASTTPNTKEPTYDNPLPPGVALNLAANGCGVSRSNQVCLSEIRHAMPVDPGILKEKPDVKLVLPIGFFKYQAKEMFVPNTYRNFLVPSANSVVVETLNNISSSSPTAPPLSQLEDVSDEMFCNGDNLPANCKSEVCTCIHLIKIPLNSIVEIVLVDEFNSKYVRHPFHLHGFAFHVMGMGQPLGPTSDNSTRMTVDYFNELEMNNKIARNYNSPPSKDNVPVPNNGYAILRFRANNPGYWMFHCHQLFHLLAGMELTFQVGEPNQMPPTPKNFPRCGNFKPAIQLRN